MKLCKMRHPLYLVTDVSGMDFGTLSLQVRDGIDCVNNETADSTILHPIAFMRESLFSAKNDTAP